MKTSKFFIIGIEGKDMKIRKLDVKDIAGIRDLHLEFGDKLNVLCGENGVGKTTILNLIEQAFYDTGRIVKNSKETKGSYGICFFSDGEECAIKRQIIRGGQQGEATVNHSEGVEYENISGADLFQKLNDILCIGLIREFEYNPDLKLHGTRKLIPADPNIVLRTGRESEYITNWLVNRFLFFDKEGAMPLFQKENYKLALKTLQMLDDKISLKTIKADTLDVVLQTQSGDAFLYEMCSGYKSCLYLIIGLIEEIENRFEQKIEEFDGVILIDEIDAHLHPIWQNKIVQVLKNTFPNAQLIMTTHSPSVLQNLKKEEIIPLMRDEEGNVLVKELHLGEYGLQGWTLEEIMEDVMGMPETRSETFETVKNAFDKAMNHEDAEEIKRTHQILEKMLHPNNVLKTLLRIQTAGMEE